MPQPCYIEAKPRPYRVQGKSNTYYMLSKRVCLHRILIERKMKLELGNSEPSSQLTIYWKPQHSRPGPEACSATKRLGWPASFS